MNQERKSGPKLPSSSEHYTLIKNIRSGKSVVVYLLIVLVRKTLAHPLKCDFTVKNVLFCRYSVGKVILTQAELQQQQQRMKITSFEVSNKQLFTELQTFEIQQIQM